MHEILHNAEAVIGRAHGNPEGVHEVVIQLFTPKHHEHGMNVRSAERSVRLEYYFLSPPKD